MGAPFPLALANLDQSRLGLDLNAGGLGDLLFRGLARSYPAMILAGIIAIVALAIVTDVALRAVERLTPLARAQRAAGR